MSISARAQCASRHRAARAKRPSRSGTGRESRPTPSSPRVPKLSQLLRVPRSEVERHRLPRMLPTRKDTPSLAPDQGANRGRLPRVPRLSQLPRIPRFQSGTDSSRLGVKSRGLCVSQKIMGASCQPTGHPLWAILPLLIGLVVLCLWDSSYCAASWNCCVVS